MSLRPARRPQPALTALLAGVLLLCAFLMAGGGHADTMPMPAAMDSTPTAGMGAMTASPDSGHGPAFSDTGGDGCAVMAMDCPLASAHSPAPVTVAAPALVVTAQPPAVAARLPLPAGVSCVWPRAPDPLSLLCISRT
ncbi:hypothetical protein [Streptomyces sp. NPDC002104]